MVAGFGMVVTGAMVRVGGGVVFRTAASVMLVAAAVGFAHHDTEC